MRRVLPFAVVSLWLPLAGAFVAGPSSLNDGESALGIEVVQERGTVEPHTDRRSYQSARIDVEKLSYTRGFGSRGSFEDVTVRLDYGQFRSAAEMAEGIVFHEADRGSFVGVEVSGNILHDADRVFGFLIRANPFVDMDDAKFSNPRLDTFGIGMTGQMNLSENFYFKNLVYHGTGFKAQNPSLAVDNGVGYRLDALVGRPAALSASLFLEADLRDRFDEKYDAAFSAAGTRDRVRSFKYGTVLGLDIEPFDRGAISLRILDKLGGYDARATQVLTVGFTWKL